MGSPRQGPRVLRVPVAATSGEAGAGASGEEGTPHSSIVCGRAELHSLEQENNGQDLQETEKSGKN
ncbi:hypothetical protein C0J52_21918 [Blattella germanica]|nr:hypothetical protein C0J52_21918 [Blattella germanica]